MPNKLIRNFYAFMSDEGGEDLGGGAGGSEAIAPVTVEGAVEGTTPISIGITDHEWSDKPWFSDLLKNEDPGSALLKQHDNLLTKLGQGRPTPPESYEDSDKWDDYYKSVRPEYATEYTVSGIEVPEEADEKAKTVYDAVNSQLTDEYKGFIQSTFHKVGLTKAQANVLVSEFNNYTKQQAEASLADTEAKITELHTEFTSIAEKEFGAKYEEALAEAKSLINKHVPEEVRKYNHALSNEALMQLALNTRHILKAYGVSDGPIKTAAGVSGSGAQSLADLNAEYRAWYADNIKIIRDFSHPKHDMVMRKEQEFTEKIRNASQK